MAIYRFQSGPVLSEVTTHVNDSGGVRANLRAQENATSEQLQQVMAAVASRGWKYVPTTHNGIPVLEVRGAKKPEEMLAFLQQNGFASGTPAVTAQEGDIRSTKEKLANATLKVAGLSYNIGDLSYLFYSAGPLVEDWKKLDKKGRMFGGLDVVAGLGYMAGSLALTRYGGRDQSQNSIHNALKKVDLYMRREGMATAEDSTAKQLLHEPKRSLWGKLDHLMGKYPSETLNAVYVGVGACLSAVAFYRGTRPIDPALTGKALKEALGTRSAFRSDVGLGMVTGASAIAGLAIKEKKPVEGEPKKTGLGRVWEWIQEKPLRATGYGYMVATLFHGWGTFKHYRSGGEIKPIYLFGRAVFVVSNLLSEFLLTISSKGHGHGVKPDDSIDKTVIAATAETILRQPPEKQPALVQQLAGYMASPEVLGGKAEEIAGELQTQLNALRANPWVAKAMPALPPAANDRVTPANDTLTPAATKPAMPLASVRGVAHQNMVSAAPEMAVGAGG